MLVVFMCRDPADTRSKGSCCVEPSLCFKNSYFDASVEGLTQIHSQKSLG